MLGVGQDYVGIDFGSRKIKLVWMRGLEVRKMVTVEMPDNAMQDGRLASPSLLGSLIRETMRENGIRCRQAAAVVPSDSVIIRNVLLPKMQEAQLRYNLPFEFRDYIQGEIRDYVFDYEFVSEDEGEDGKLRLLAVSIRQEALEDLRTMARYAGMRLAKAAPAVCAYEAILLNAKAEDISSCFIDIGYGQTRMLMFQGAHYMATDTLESGLSRVISEIADSYGVDAHLAQTYLEKNFEGCQELEGCQEVFHDMFSDIQRALNFFEFNNPNVSLSKAWICGGGSLVGGLVDLLRERLPLEVGTAEELFGMEGEQTEINLALQAAGITRN